MINLKDLKKGDTFITKNGRKVTYSHTDEFGLYMFNISNGKINDFIPYRPNGTRYNYNENYFDIVGKFIDETNTSEERVNESLNGNKLVYDYIDKVPKTKEFSEKYKRYCKNKVIMSPLEYARYLQYCEDHKQPDIGMGALGGDMEISYMPTGLGNIIKVKCDLCGAEADITDSSCW